MFSRKLMLLFALLVVVAMAVAACGPGGGANTGAGSQTVNVEGNEFKFTPSTINAKPGERVTVNFKNTGSVEHTFDIRDVNFKLTAPAGRSVSGTFTAPSTAGTYNIVCDVPGHTEAGMVGQLVVQ